MNKIKNRKLEEWNIRTLKEETSILFLLPRYYIFILLAVFLAGGCGQKKNVKGQVQKQLPLVQVVKAEKRDFIKTFTYTGSIEPVKFARIASPAEGPIVKCTIREGDLVVAEQVLVKIGRNRIAEAALDAAREELRRQDAEFKRVEQLVKSGSIPPEQMDIARVNLKRAEAQVSAMETGVGDYEIKAPWNGVVSRVWIAEGNYVAPRITLVELYDPSSLVIRVAIPEYESTAIHTGQSVNVSLDAYPDRRFSGTIVRIYPELDRATRTLTVEAVLNENVRLFSGMFARVSVAVRTLPGAVVVPDSVLVAMPDGEVTAFVLVGDTAVRRKIKTAVEADGFVAVSSGIEAGETVIVRGNEMLNDGTKVQVVGQKKQAPTASPVGAKKLKEEPKS